MRSMMDDTQILEHRIREVEESYDKLQKAFEELAEFVNTIAASVERIEGELRKASWIE